MAGETSQTLDRGLRVLLLLGSTSDPLTVNEIAARLDVGRTVVYRLLATLEQHDLVRRDGDGRVRLDVGVLRLARHVRPALRELALPALRRLADDVGATAHLTVADGAEAVAVAVVEPSRTDYHVAYREGARHPLDRGAAGRAIAALGSGRRLSPSYVVSEGELQPGAFGVAAPLPGGAVLLASVGVVALAPLDAAVVGPRVVEAAAEVAATLPE